MNELNKFIDEYTSKFYLNEDVNPDSYRKLSLKDKQLTTSHLTLLEFASIKELIGNITKKAKKNDFDLEALQKSGNMKYLKDIKDTKGDVTRCKNYSNIIELIKYSKAVNNRISNIDESQKNYLEKLNIIERAYDNLVKHKPLFVKAIVSELRDSNDTLKIATEFYSRIVGLLEVTFDVLYSASINAEFDYNVKPPMVKNISFRYSNELLDEPLMFIHYFNIMATSGKLKSMLEKINEDTYSLEVSIGRKLNENVLDVAFSLLSNSRIFDAIILFPIYLIRYITYLFKYMIASYNAINTNFEDAIKIKRSTNLTASEFDSYKKTTSGKDLKVQQSSRKSEMESDRFIKTISKEQLSSESNSSSSNVLI
jgi:hypothetical protein